MVKVENLGMDLLYFQNSKTWDYGTYKILNSDIRNYGARKEDGTLDETILERILYSHSNKALNQIKKDIDTKGILNVFTWSDLAGSRFIEALPLVMEAQLSGMITDGNKEIKKGSSYSGAGVDASVDASSFMLSHDRIYKAAEDVWFNNQLDKYEIEEGEDEHGNTTYSLIDTAEGTVTTIVATILLTPEQEKAIADKIAQNIGSNSKFDLVNLNGKDVIQPKLGRDLLLVDEDGNPINPSSPNSAASVAVAEQKAKEASKDKADKSSTYSKTEVDSKVAAKADAGASYTKAEADAKLVGKQDALTVEQIDVLGGRQFTTEEKNYLANLRAGGNYLGDIQFDADVDPADIATAIDAAYPNRNPGDHIEVIQPSSTTPNTLTYTTYTATLIGSNLEWGIGAVKLIHLKAGVVDSYTKTETDSKLGDKADKATTYSKTEIDSKVVAKADAGASYTKAEADAKLVGKQDALTDAQKAILNSNAFTDAEKAKLAKALTAHQDISGKANVGDSYTKVESDAKYEPLTTFFTPATSHQAGFIITDETGIKDVSIGTQVKLDLKGIDDMITNPADIPAAGDKLFIGSGGAVRIPNAGGTASLKWETKTNATDINVKDNYKTKYFVLKKVSATEYDFVRLEDKPQVAKSKTFIVKIGAFDKSATHDIPFDNIISGTVIAGPTFSEARTVALMKSTDTVWEGQYYTSQPYKVLVRKTADGKVELSDTGNGVAAAYSLTYWKDA